MWTESQKGQSIKVYEAFDATNEAHFVVNIIKKLTKYQYKEFAILYRANAQSRIFEERLIGAKIPYIIYGGIRFLERLEVKDALAYLRVIANPHDDLSLERIINRPTRGIGNNTIEALKNYASNANCSWWQLLLNQEFLQENFNNRVCRMLDVFVNLINELRNKIDILNLVDLTEYMLEKTNLLQFYRAKKEDREQEKANNLLELINACQQFQNNQYNKIINNNNILSEFLSHVSIDKDHIDDINNNKVQLMTLHAAKGLEFPVVFLVGLEEGLFPHQLVQNQSDELQEERRLCYVGITRAKKELYLSYAKSRFIQGKEYNSSASRFINELPIECLVPIIDNHKKHDTKKYNNFNKKIKTIVTKQKNKSGKMVMHTKFGQGIIVNIAGQGANATATVKFAKYGNKKLKVSYLTIL